MIRKTVVFEENIHHTCLTFGLKRSFEKMPFLNRKTLNIKGCNRLIDNIVSLPPMMRKIEKSLDKRKNRNIVEVSYFKNKLSVEFNEEFCNQDEISAFFNTLIIDYLSFRHPYMQINISEKKVCESLSGHIIAQID